MSSSSSGAPSPLAASRRASLLAGLRACEGLAVRLNIALAVALDNALPPLREEGRRAQSNAPWLRLAAAGAGTERKPLRSRLRRLPGAPFFVAHDGGLPAGAAGAAAPARGKAEGPGKEPWTAAEDAALEAAVARLARARALEAAWARAGLPLPARLRPLGGAAPHALPAPEPHAQEQFDDGLLAAAAARAARAAGERLPPAAAAALAADVAAALDAPRDALLLGAAAAAGGGLDWPRAAAGGFFPARSVQTAEDCKVRWLAHLRPRAAARAAAAAAREPPPPPPPRPAAGRRAAAAAADAALAAAVAAHGTRNWAAVAAALPPPAPSPLQALAAYQQRLAPELRAAETAPLAPADDARVAQLVAVYGAADWDAVAQFLPAHTPKRIARHHDAVVAARAAAAANAAAAGDAAALSRDDRARLAVLVRVYGDAAWDRIAAAHMPGRAAAALEAAWRRDAADAEAAHADDERPFAPDEDARLRAGFADDGDARAAARDLARPLEAVLWRQLALTVPRPPEPAARKRKLAAAAAAAAADDEPALAEGEAGEELEEADAAEA
jgi:hypothetical protein